MTADLMEQDIPGEIFSFQAMFPHDDGYNDSVHWDILAFKAKANPDTLYLHEALRELEKQKFIEGMGKEINSQVEMGVKSSRGSNGAACGLATEPQRRY